MPKISQLPDGGVQKPTDAIPITRSGATYQVVNNPSFVDPKTYGAANNGNTNDKAALQAAFDASIALKNSVLVTNSAVATTLNLSGVVTIPGGFITSTIVIDNPTISLTGSRNIITGLQMNVPIATAIQMSTNGVNNTIITNSIISASFGYGILDNDATSDALIIANSIISADADAVEFNHPVHPGSNRICIGNVLDTPGAVAGGNAGFPVGVAQINSYIVMGNCIKNARQAAIHIEDLNTRGVVIGNTAETCLKQGFSLQVPVPGKGFPDPCVGGFNNMKHTGTKTNYVGINVIGDANGNADQFVSMGNCMNGFDFCTNAADGTHAYFEGNIALNCNAATFGTKHCRIFGRHSAKNTPILCIGQSGAVIDPIYSTTAVTTILSKNGGNYPGPMLKGWGLPKAIVHTGSGVEAFTIAAMPSLFYGDIQIIIEASGAACVYVATIKWDGSSLTTPTEKIKGLNGSLTDIDITTAGGNLQMSIASASPFTNSAKIEFDGSWIVN